MRLEPLESQVGGDFEENVGHEEDGEGDIVLLSVQFEILFETGKTGLTDVDLNIRGKWLV